MKTNIILLTFLGMVGSLQAVSPLFTDYQEPKAVCMGDIIFPFEVDPNVRLYYKGDRLFPDITYEKKPKSLKPETNEKQQVRIIPYSLSEVKSTQIFHMLICAYPHCKPKSNTIDYIHVPENMPYKFYTLRGAREYDQDRQVTGCLWTVTEERLAHDGRVPDNTIIFVFNADHVQGLEVKSWPLNSNIRLLPSIVIKKNIDPVEICQAIVQGCIAGIDLDPFHKNYSKHSRKIDKKTVVMVVPS